MSIIYLTGVLEDGSQRAPGVPANPRVEIRVPRLGDWTVVLTAVLPGGSPLSLAGATTRLTARKRPGSFKAVMVDGAPMPGQSSNVVQFVGLPAATRYAPEGRYVYDVRALVGGRWWVLVGAAPFVVEPNVGEP